MIFTQAAAALRTQDGPAGSAAWAVADNADPAAPGQLIAAARDRFGRLDGALISVGGSPTGTVAGTEDDAWRSAFESVFLGAVRLARVLADGLDGENRDGTGTGALPGTGGSWWRPWPDWRWRPAGPCRPPRPAPGGGISASARGEGCLRYPA